MNRFTLAIGLFTLLVFGLGGFVLIEWVQQKTFLEEMQRGWPWAVQILAGVAAGGISAALALYLITRPFFSRQKKMYYDLIATRLRLTPAVIIFLSLCAGIGEELFFRAGLQPVLGLWTTSVIFVGLHGYLHLRNWRIASYGVLMILIIAGFGYLYRYTGIISPITAHSIFDLVLFSHIYKSNRGNISQETDFDEKPLSSSQ